MLIVDEKFIFFLYGKVATTSLEVQIKLERGVWVQRAKLVRKETVTIKNKTSSGGRCEIAERCERSERPKRLQDEWVQSPAKLLISSILKIPCEMDQLQDRRDTEIHPPSQPQEWPPLEPTKHFLGGCDSEDPKREQTTVTLLLGDCKDDIYQ